MKKIDIQGKRNQDKMKQMADPDAILEKKIPKKSKLDNDIYYTDQSIGLSILKEFVMNHFVVDTTSEQPSSIETQNLTLNHLIRDIEAKRKAYIYQDKQHSIYDPRYSITLEQIVSLIVDSELLCYYCRDSCKLTYKEVMCRKQWTLDRIDNDYGHNHTNVVIACLDCNLKRGNMDSDRFRQGKQFTFRKLE
jgi:hypothetical protein